MLVRLQVPQRIQQTYNEQRTTTYIVIQQLSVGSRTQIGTYNAKVVCCIICFYNSASCSSFLIHWSDYTLILQTQHPYPNTNFANIFPISLCIFPISLCKNKHGLCNFRSSFACFLSLCIFPIILCNNTNKLCKFQLAFGIFQSAFRRFPISLSNQPLRISN